MVVVIIFKYLMGENGSLPEWSPGCPGSKPRYIIYSCMCGLPSHLCWLSSCLYMLFSHLNVLSSGMCVGSLLGPSPLGKGSKKKVFNGIIDYPSFFLLLFFIVVRSSK
eukprot:TRINITY_DN7678_c0_g1_i2.p1 TRINITY_DN7678_c0_g1~~TRINITY_DN7678_c0_g1_i2.p1  ORF type:complete len:108 (+),score=1.37 TRINITY_DN7678_c0_g1_i2:832-1155(+)